MGYPLAYPRFPAPGDKLSFGAHTQTQFWRSCFLAFSFGVHVLVFSFGVHASGKLSFSVHVFWRLVLAFMFWCSALAFMLRANSVLAFMFFGVQFWRSCFGVQLWRSCFGQTQFWRSWQHIDAKNALGIKRRRKLTRALQSPAYICF